MTGFARFFSLLLPLILMFSCLYVFCYISLAAGNCMGFILQGIGFVPASNVPRGALHWLGHFRRPFPLNVHSVDVVV